MKTSGVIFESISQFLPCSGKEAQLPGWHQMTVKQAATQENVTVNINSQSIFHFADIILRVLFPTALRKTSISHQVH